MDALLAKKLGWTCAEAAHSPVSSYWRLAPEASALFDKNKLKPLP
jgi:hypothetical protein